MIANPGSDEARTKGCNCPIDQKHADKDQFIINGHCPVHGQEAKARMQEVGERKFRVN